LDYHALIKCSFLLTQLSNKRLSHRRGVARQRHITLEVKYNYAARQVHRLEIFAVTMYRDIEARSSG